MEPTFVDREAFTVMGVQERFTPETEDFECTVKTIRDTYEFIHHAWIGNSPYILDDPKPGFEHYPPDTASGDSPVLIHVPVRERAAP